MDYVVPNIPRIHTALAEWAAGGVFILIYSRQIRNPVNMFKGVIALILQCTIQVVAGMLPLPFWIPGMLLAIAAMYFGIYNVTGLQAADAAYICVRAFVLAEFAASLEWQISCYFIYAKNGTQHIYWETVIMILVYLIVFVFMYAVERRLAQGNGQMGVKPRELIAAAAMGVVIFTISNIGFVYSNTPFSARFDQEIFIVRTIMNFAGLAVLYNHCILSAELRKEKEMDAIRSVLQRQFSQYELFQENIELLNMKYHDLKNQIGIIRAEENLEKKEGYLDEMEELLQVYDAKSGTGNQVVDTILSGKKLLCLEHDIELTTVVNGKLLEFMNEMDVCTIFGNALDNAIECEKQIEEKEKRMIHVTVFSQKNLLMIRIENYFEGELRKVVEGIPETTKRDKRFHGFGLKSIRYSARRYGGSVTVDQKDNWFVLKVLIPMGR